MIARYAAAMGGAMKHAATLAAFVMTGVGFGAGIAAAHLGESSGSLPTTPILDPGNSDIGSIIVRQRTMAAALAPLDTATLLSIMAPDMRALNAADQVLDRSAAIQLVREMQGQLLRVEDDSFEVRLYGPVAIMGLRERVTFRADSGESTGRLRMTEVWFKRAGSWTAVASHATLLP